MTREEATKICRALKAEAELWGEDEANKALDMAIEALKREPSEDGTLEIKVEDATKVGRVLISDDEHRGGLYYPDEDEPKGDLISRAEALMEARPEYLSPEQIGHEEYNKGWSDAISMYRDNLNALPAKTQDRPTDSDIISRADAIEALGEEQAKVCIIRKAVTQNEIRHIEHRRADQTRTEAERDEPG